MSEILTSLPKPGDSIGGAYRIECQLGSERAAAMFGATVHATGERCAIRCWLSSDAPAVAAATQQFIRVAREADLFKHRSIVEVFAVGEVDGTVYSVTEWLEGMTLQRFLDRNGPMPPRDALTLLLPCIEALAEAHSAGIIHGDLLPANVFLVRPTRDEPERARLLNFGLGGMSGRPVVLERKVVGDDRQFVTPEELRHDPIDERSDVYALGVILYVTLVGELPFAAGSGRDLARAIHAGERSPLPERLPSDLTRLVERAMASEPARRFQSLPEMLRAIAHFDDRVSPHFLRAAGLAEHAFVWVKPAAAYLPRFEAVEEGPSEIALREVQRRDREERAAERKSLVYLTAVAVGLVLVALVVRLVAPHVAHISATPRPASVAAVDDVTVRGVRSNGVRSIASDAPVQAPADRVPSVAPSLPERAPLAPAPSPRGNRSAGEAAPIAKPREQPGVAPARVFAPVPALGAPDHPPAPRPDIGALDKMRLR